ncbi:MAG: hypothetical protein Q8M04_02510 [Pseudomonadota bacterium]|nr:hypothetical protein [Pseudomonadota bacterium]
MITMQTIRVVAVGLLIAAELMIETSQMFFSYWVTQVPFFSWALGVRTIAAPIAATGGFDFVPAATFSMLCMGFGLLLSAIIYVQIENLVNHIAITLNLKLGSKYAANQSKGEVH